MQLFPSPSEAENSSRDAASADKPVRAENAPHLQRSDDPGRVRLPRPGFGRRRISGQALRSALIEKTWLRWLMLPIILAIGAVTIMTPDERAMVAMKAIYFIGHGSPAVLIGAATGWITFSRKWWLWSTAVLGALTLAVALQGVLAR